MAVYLNTITPFDASESCTFTFTYSGGNQAYFNKLIIKDSSTLETVYEKKMQSLRLSHILDKNLLENGKEYLAIMEVYDVNDILQGTSPITPFQCLSTPIFLFSNLEDGQTLYTSSYNFCIKYEQAEGELLQSYNVTLYDNNKVERYNTGKIYDTEELNTTISLLEDNTEYYIVATGITINGIQLNTGYVKFNCDYITPSSFFLVELSNEKKYGAIKITSNAVQIEGKMDEEPIFLDNEYLDLRDSNGVTFDEGIDLKNGTIIGLLYAPERNEAVCKFVSSDNKSKVFVYYRIGAYESTGGQEKAYLELVIPRTYSSYVIRSNFIDIPEDDDILAYCITKSKNYYDIKLKNNGKRETS